MGFHINITGRGVMASNCRTYARGTVFITSDNAPTVSCG